MLKRTSGRPSRPDVEQAALGLIADHGAEILATARRYSATPEDAEDAYQRGLEILLLKAPTTAEGELVPWLKTVVKHEAFAIRRQRGRKAPVTDDGEVAEVPSAEAATHQQAERYERLRLGAEALGRLKPQEIRCLLLKAQGLSYKEIQSATGFSYTKVNRCLTEGRRAFLSQVAGIEAGAECQRLAPLLSALADGEASAADLNALRPHLKSCLACRARLREFRTAPKRVAALLPPVAVVAQPGPLRSFVESLVSAAQHKAAALGERAHTAAELATGQKVAAVAASAAALGGGGAGVKELAVADDPPPAHHAPQHHSATAPASSPNPVPPAAAPKPVPTAQPQPAPQQTPKPPAPTPEAEFAPGAAPAPTPSPAASKRPAGDGSGGGGSAEFGP